MAERDFVVGQNIVADNVPLVSTTTISSNSATPIALFDKSIYETAQFIVRANQNGGRTQRIVSVLHNGTTVDSTEYGRLDFVRNSETVALSGGTTWTTQTSGVATNLNDITFANNTWLAVGTSGTIITSTDAITWVTRTSGTANEIFNVVYGNGQWCAGTKFGQILKSTDTITWSAVNAGLSGDVRVGFVNNTFGAGGATGAFSTSTNLNSFSSATNPGIGSIYTIASYEGIGWIVGAIGGAKLTVDSGTTWNAITTGFGASAIRKVVWVDGLNGVAVGDGGKISSIDGGQLYTWTTQTSGVASNLLGAGYGNGRWVVVGASGTILTSTDRVTWSSVTSTFGTTTVGATFYNNGLWTATGDAGQIRTSAISTQQPSVPLTLTTDISGNNVRLLAQITDAATYPVTVNIHQTMLSV